MCWRLLPTLLFPPWHPSISQRACVSLSKDVAASMLRLSQTVCRSCKTWAISASKHPLPLMMKKSPVRSTTERAGDPCRRVLRPTLACASGVPSAASASQGGANKGVPQGVWGQLRPKGPKRVEKGRKEAHVQTGPNRPKASPRQARLGPHGPKRAQHGPKRAHMCPNKLKSGDLLSPHPCLCTPKGARSSPISRIQDALRFRLVFPICIRVWVPVRGIALVGLALQRGKGHAL